jgi:integrase
VQRNDPHGEKKASLSDQAVYKMVKRCQREAWIKEVSPHDFRKTFVGDLLDAIGDLSTVQKLAGHSDPATTVAARVRCGRPANRRLLTLLYVARASFRTVSEDSRSFFPVEDVGADPQFYPPWR